MISLLCLDVDGTLVGASGVVPAAVWPAAAELRAAGVRLAVCTGRPGFGIARGFAERLDPDGWHVFQNGASVVQVGSGASRSTPLAEGVVPMLVARTREARARGSRRALELYGDAGYVVEYVDDAGPDGPEVAGALNDRARRHAELIGVPYRSAPLGGLRSAIGGPVVRAQWLVPLEESDGIAGEPLGGLVVAPSLAPSMPDSGFVNLTAPGVDKAAAIRGVAAAYGVPMAEVMMVGDGANDVSALRAAGLGVAMGNAEPAARAAAARVVGDVDAGGLLEAFAIARGGRGAAAGAPAAR